MGSTMKSNMYGPIVLAQAKHSGISVLIQFIQNFHLRSEVITEPSLMVDLIQRCTKIQSLTIMKTRGIILPSSKNRLSTGIVVDGQYAGSLDDILSGKFTNFNKVEWDNTRKSITILGIAMAIRDLHECHINHLYLTPEMIIFNMKFEPYLMGYFYSSICVNNKQILQLHNNGRYVAPERSYPSGRDSDKCDVFSFGVIVYEIITGHKPFEEDMTSTKQANYPSFPSNVPNMWAVILGRCMHIDPIERPSMNEIINSILVDRLFVYDDADQRLFAEYSQRIGAKQFQVFPEDQLSSTITDLRFLCAQKDAPESQFRLATLLDSFSDRPKSIQEATLYYLKAAQSGYADAQDIIFRRFLAGKGVQKNYNHADKFLNIAVESGHPKSVATMASILTERGQRDKAIEILRKANLEYELAVAEFDTDKRTEAVELLKKLVEAGDERAAVFINVKTLAGEVPELPLDIAFEALEILSNRWVPEAQYELGLIYEKEGKQDASVLIEESAERGYPPAILKVGIEKSDRSMIQKAAFLGHVPAILEAAKRAATPEEKEDMLRLGMFYGSREAMVELASMLAHGETNRNISEAVSILQQAVSYGYTPATEELKRMEKEGLYTFFV